MLDSLKNFMFPCDKIMKELLESHSVAAAENAKAHERLMSVCSGGSCMRKPSPSNNSKFPPIERGKIVNPR